MLICLYAFMVIRLDALMITWPHVCMLWCLHVFTSLITHLSKCFDNCMVLCSHVWLLTHSYVLMITCSHAHMPWWSHDPMLKCFDDHMLPYSHALMILYPHAYMIWSLMLTCIDIHMFDIHTRVHTWIMIWIYAWMLKWTCNWMFVRTNALTIVLECWGDGVVRGLCTLMLKCSYACVHTHQYALILICLYTPMLKRLYVQLIITPSRYLYINSH